MRCWSSFLSPFSLSLTSTLSLHSLPVLCAAQHPQCRRGSKPLHSRTMRSIVPWRYTIRSHKRDINSAELETMRTSRSPTTVLTANGEVQTREEATVCVREMDLFVRVLLLEETPTLLSLGKLCDDHGYTCHWTSGQQPHLTKKDKRIDCNISNCVPFVVPGLSTSSSSTTPSPTSSISSSQDSVFEVRRYTENPVPERSGSTSEGLRGNSLHRSTETENKKKMEKQKRYKAIYCMTCLIGCRSSKRIWSMNVILQRHGETLSLDIERLPDLLMNYQWSRERKWNRVRVGTVCIHTFRRTQIAISA